MRFVERNNVSGRGQSASVRSARRYMSSNTRLFTGKGQFFAKVSGRLISVAVTTSVLTVAAHSQKFAERGGGQFDLAVFLDFLDIPGE